MEPRILQTIAHQGQCLVFSLFFFSFFFFLFPSLSLSFFFSFFFCIFFIRFLFFFLVLLLPSLDSFCSVSFPSVRHSLMPRQSTQRRKGEVIPAFMGNEEGNSRTSRTETRVAGLLSGSGPGFHSR